MQNPVSGSTTQILTQGVSMLEKSGSSMTAVYAGFPAFPPYERHEKAA
jgi:hypothetical protein